MQSNRETGDARVINLEADALDEFARTPALGSESVDDAIPTEAAPELENLQRRRRCAPTCRELQQHPFPAE